VKHYTSQTLKLIAFFYLSFPIIYVILSALIFDVPARSCVRMLLSPLFIIISIFAMISGYGLWEMKRWAWHVFFAANVVIVYLNAIVVQDYSESHHKLLAFLFSLCLALGTLLRVAREVRVPYFFPKIRWWESNPRYRLGVPALLLRKDGAPLDGQILDLSMSGCFVKLRHDVNPDELVQIKFTVFKQDVDCQGVIVWRSKSTVTHPKGVGIKFGPLERPQKRVLRLITRRLKQIAAFYRTARYLMNQEDFIKRLEEMENSSIDRLRTRS
jgi:hypothetical protein